MAGEMRRIQFAATTRDIEQWHPDWRAAAEASGRGYHDWIFAQLEGVMSKAGQDFIDKHPDLFACDLG